MKKTLVRGLLCAALLLSSTAILSPAPYVYASGAVTLDYVFDAEGNAYVKSGNVTGAVTVPATVPNSDGTRSAVVGIAAEAFRGTSITSVTLPASLLWVGDGAFSDCVNLESVNFSSASARLGGALFAGCENVALAGTDNIVYVGKNALENTAYLAEHAADNELYIGKCLYRSTADGDVTLKAGTLSIAPEVFKGATVYSVTFCDGFQIIGDDAFSGCDALYTLRFGNSLTEIGARAFDGSALMGYPAFPTNLEKIGAYAFRNCTLLSGVELYGAESLTSLPNGAFYGCDSLVRAELPPTITSIGDNCFYADSELSELSCTGLRLIGIDAFRNCSALSEGAVFFNVEAVGTGAFDGTALLKNADDEVWIGSALYRFKNAEVTAYDVHATSVTARAGIDCVFDRLTLCDTLESIGEKALPLAENATIVSVTRTPAVYDYFEGMTYKTLYMPSGVLETRPQNAVYLTGLEVTSLPTKLDYKADEELDLGGLSVALVAEDGKRLVPHCYKFRYDFHKSGIVTVSCGEFKTTFTVRVTGAAKAGDLNGDGNVDAIDLALMRQYLAGLIPKEDLDLSAADVDGNGGVDTGDLLALRRTLSGL